MSQLTDKTKIYYVPVIYNRIGSRVTELEDFEDEESAIIEANTYICGHVVGDGIYYHAVIEKRVCPIYE